MGSDFPVTFGRLQLYGDVAYHHAENAAADAQNLLKFLYSDLKLDRRFFSSRIRSALFYKRDPELLQEVRKELQALINKLFHALQNGTDVRQEKFIEMQLGHFLAIYPFLEPESGMTLHVPQKVDAQGKKSWQLLEYEVQKFKLSPPSLGSPICAFGLLPKQLGAPLLLFKGTPHPTSPGAYLSFWADFVPGYTVGGALFSFFAKKKISAWIDDAYAHAQMGIKIYGKSLGGALALLTENAHPGKVAEVHAYCAPGLLVTGQSTASVHLYFRENDPVQLLGNYHPHWHLYKILTAMKKNMFLAHLRAFPGLSNLVVIQRDTLCESKRFARKCFTAAHFLISIPIFIVTSSILLVKTAYMFTTALYKQQ